MFQGLPRKLSGHNGLMHCKYYDILSEESVRLWIYKTKYIYSIYKVAVSFRKGIVYIRKSPLQSIPKQAIYEISVKTSMYILCQSTY